MRIDVPRGGCADSNHCSAASGATTTTTPVWVALCGWHRLLLLLAADTSRALRPGSVRLAELCGADMDVVRVRAAFTLMLVAMAVRGK